LFFLTPLSAYGSQVYNSHILLVAEGLVDIDPGKEYAVYKLDNVKLRKFRKKRKGSTEPIPDLEGDDDEY